MEETERQHDGKESPMDQSHSANTWRNGQCVASVLTSRFVVTPRFDLSNCRTHLKTKGFQIPVEDFEGPLQLALDDPSVRRYLLFNSYIFHVFMAPVLYVVLWCAIYSTLHKYLETSTTDFWVLCLCVSLVSIIITAAILLIFHYSNKEINMNTDVRLVAVNEHTIRHRLLLGVADWVHKCRGRMQLCCVYWDLSPCLRSLTECLDNMSYFSNQVEKKLKKKMSHLVLVTEVTSIEPEEEEDEFLEEERPLLLTEREQTPSSSQRDDSKLTQNFSLKPDSRLANQAIAEQLLMAYSALYVRLLVLDKLPVLSQNASAAGRHHCYSSLCLCEFVELKILR